VTFIPEAGPVATATTDLEGKFKLMTGGSEGVALGDCKVTVVAFEGGGASADSRKGPTAASASTEEERRKAMTSMANMQKGIATGQEGGGSAAKSIIPEIYSKVESSGLSFKVDSDKSKNQFAITLKD
jgi:hypothetical protein